MHFPLNVFISILLVSLSSGLGAQQFLENSTALGISHITYAPNMMSGGVAVLDYNNDGFEDLYFTGGQYPDHLYKNNGDGTFTDVTLLMGIDALSDRYTMGVVSGDLDNDGFTDLFVTTYKGEQNICLKNNGGDSFEDVTREVGFFGTKWSATATMGDIDLDGDLDIYVSNFIDFSDFPFFNHITALEPNFLFENLGNWRFKGKNDLFPNHVAGCTLVSCFTDVDNDRDQDLFVINDFGKRHTPNQLYINTDNGEELAERSEELAINDGIDGMGIAIGDIDENGFLDYYMTNIRDNLFYLGGEGLNFSEGHLQYNVNDGLGDYSWGTFIADVNNDSYQDLFVAKGSISESIDLQFNKLYQFEKEINDFIDMSIPSGLDDGGKARGAVYADLNNDGWLDIIVNNVRVREDNPGHPLIYINQGGDTGDFLKLRLEGVACNRAAYGSRVVLYSGSRRLIREVNGGSSYCSNNSQVVHFGLPNSKIDSVVVYWAGGQVQTLSDISPNSFYLLQEGKSLELYHPDFATTTYDGMDKLDATYSIYPNPAVDKLTIEFSSRLEEGVIIELINNIGNVELVHRIGHGHDLTVNMDLKEVGPGVHYIRIRNRNSTSIKKLVLLR